MKLSDLKVGDDFHFVSGQIAKYKVSHKINYFSGLETSEHIVYEVLKKNKKSLLCRVLFGSIQYFFVFDGVDSNYDNGIDCDVIIMTKK